MSDFATKHGTEERGSSGKDGCVFDWTPGEAVRNSGKDAHPENVSSVVFESDIFPDVIS
ncbi:MAG: hypothetical protein IAB75_11135 [Bacteroidetes bacterium]|jgi:hypothetical protein|uniref:Uncharacterized protein n=1 Tax=Candidatus Cryptobacteroides avicola TaxID=2840757 RepID=A0A940IJI3_9BACT|nr:hypothetical protein [Candidatus Cryptobacteroides avicola]